MTPWTALWIWSFTLVFLSFFLGRRCGYLDEKSRWQKIGSDKFQADAHLLKACEHFQAWMLCGQPGPHSDSRILDIVKRAIEKAKSVGRKELE